MADKHWVLAIDQGGQSTRVAIFDSFGHEVASRKKPIHTDYLPGKKVELNADNILLGIKQSLNELAEILGDDCKHVQCAGYAGQGSTLAFWNTRTGASLMPSLSWQDLRAESYLKNLSLEDAHIEKVTGLKVSPHYGAGKIAWALKNNAAAMTAANNQEFMAGPLASFIFEHLNHGFKEGCSHFAHADPGHAQRTLLWSRKNHNWSQELLDEFDLALDMLPTAALHRANFGTLLLGNHTVKITVAMRDQGASLFSRGFPEKNTVYVNLGTGGFIQRVSENPEPPKGQLISPLWLAENEPHLWAIEASVNGAASALDWLEQQTGQEVTPKSITQALTQCTTGMFYLLNVQGGLAAPYWRTDCVSEFSSTDLSAEQKITAWAESVIFLVSENLALMDDTKQPLKTIRITGGLAKNNALCQRLANLTKLTVERPSDSDATLRGLAYKLANAPDTWEIAPISTHFVPQVDSNINNRFTAWKKALVNMLKTQGK